MNEKKGFGVASLILGILSLLLVFMPYFGLPLAILSVIYSNKQAKSKQTGVGSAGNVLGIIGLVINGVTLLIIGVVLLFFGSAAFI